MPILKMKTTKEAIFINLMCHHRESNYKNINIHQKSLNENQENIESTVRAEYYSHY